MTDAPESTVDVAELSFEQARDELMRASGIDRHRIHRFASERCYNDPAGVVAEFLDRLKPSTPPVQAAANREIPE